MAYKYVVVWTENAGQFYKHFHTLANAEKFAERFRSRPHIYTYLDKNADKDVQFRVTFVKKMSERR